jgi:hypothetical protein
MHKLGRKKTLVTKALKNIALLLPTYATIVLGQKEACAIAIASPKEIITTKLMPITWKKNIFALLPTCATIVIAPSLANCAIVIITS